MSLVRAALPPEVAGFEPEMQSLAKMAGSYAPLRLSTMDYAENVGSQFLSLRQRLIRICSPAGAGRPQKPNNGFVFRARLWTAGSPNRPLMFSSRPIFSEALDSVILVQRFEPASDKDFFRTPGPEVGISLARARETWLELGLCVRL